IPLATITTTMSVSRRSFLKNSAMAVAAGGFLPAESFAIFKQRQLVGIQLYSVRDDMKQDPAGSLKKLAEMGYKHVEHANYVNHKFYGYGAKEFKGLLDSLGLKMPSGHTRLSAEDWDAGKKTFTDSWKATVEDAAIAGQQFMIRPSMEDTVRKQYDGL